MNDAYLERMNDLRKARGVFVVTLLLNLLVTGGKLTWGFMTGTLSMVADGFHSLLDASANVVGIVGLNISLKPPDSDHPYGHRKFEALASIVISGFMFLASFQVLQEAVHRIFSRDAHVPSVTAVSYFIMVGTLLVNLFIARYEKKKSQELASSLLAADSKHTMSDVYSSLTVIASLVGIQMHLDFLDVVASLVIVVVIFRAGFSIILAQLGTLVDEAVLDPVNVEKMVLSVPGVTGCHKIRSRGMDDHIFLDLHVQVPRHLSIEEAHEISFQVEERLRSIGGGIVDVLVHIEDDAPSLPS